MAFSSTSDFFALLRTNGTGGVDTLRMPMIDAILQTLSDAGIIKVTAGTVAPTANQSTTAWLNTQVPSYGGPGLLYLWSASAASYQPATPPLFSAFILASVNQFASSIQIVSTSGAFITQPQVSAIGVNRPVSGLGPSSTTLPSTPQLNQTFTYTDLANNFNTAPLTVSAPAGFNIAGQSSVILQTNGQSVTFRYYGLIGGVGVWGMG